MQNGNQPGLDEGSSQLRPDVLAAHQYNVPRVSVEVGYRNDSYFVRLFRHRFEILFSEFLKRLFG